MNKLEYANHLRHWAERNGFSGDEAAEIVRLARRCGVLNTHACNGDNHPRAVTLGDKNESAQLWEQDLNRWAANLGKLVEPHGFDVRFDGLNPSLVRQGDTSGQSVIIPMDK